MKNIILLAAILLLASCGPSRKVQQSNYPPQSKGTYIAVTKQVSYIQQANQIAVKVSISSAVASDEIFTVNVYDMSKLLGTLNIRIPQGQKEGFGHITYHSLPAYLSVDITGINPSTINFVVQ